MGTGNTPLRKQVWITVKPGDCGFVTILTVIKWETRVAGLESVYSECERVHHLLKFLESIDLAHIFYPISKNPVYISAEKAGLHPSCAVPAALLKGMEISLDLAVSTDMYANFEVYNYNAACFKE